MLTGMSLLAAAVIGLGLLAPAIFTLLAKVAAPICHASLPTSNIYSLGLQPNSSQAISPLFIALLVRFRIFRFVYCLLVSGWGESPRRPDLGLRLLPDRLPQ